MTDAEFRLFLDGAMLVCALMAAINLLRYKSRGASAYLLAAAFLTVGVTLYLLREKADQAKIVMSGVVVFLLLAADMIIRSKDAGRHQR